jgi:DNA-directed RNA polymerase, beta subunit/140 kD subunit
MGKQTMGTPCHTWHLQAETKLYRLQTPASPFFRPGHYDLVGLDDFAMGTNAVVAVISYTVSTFMTQRRIRVNGTVHIIPSLFGKYCFESWIYYLHL